MDDDVPCFQLRMRGRLDDVDEMINPKGVQLGMNRDGDLKIYYDKTELKKYPVNSINPYVPSSALTMLDLICKSRKLGLNVKAKVVGAPLAPQIADKVHITTFDVEQLSVLLRMRSKLEEIIMARQASANIAKRMR